MSATCMWYKMFTGNIFCLNRIRECKTESFIKAESFILFNQETRTLFEEGRSDRAFEQKTRRVRGKEVGEAK